METTKPVAVTVMLPCNNEAAALPDAVRDIRRALEGSRWPYEILVVDDGSDDGSGDVALGLGCRVVRHPARRGSGAARKTGTIVARGPLVVTMDADGSYTAADIPRLLEHFPAYDQVNGARTSEQGTLRWLRIPAKWFIRMLASFLAGRLIPDLNTGLKAYKRDLMLHYLWSVPDGFSCASSMSLAFLCNGHPVKYVPTAYHKRIGRSKFHPVRDTYLYLLTVLRLSAYFNPLKVFLPIAFLLGIGGVALVAAGWSRGAAAAAAAGLALLAAAVVVALQGLLADLVVARNRRHVVTAEEQSAPSGG